MTIFSELGVYQLLATCRDVAEGVERLPDLEVCLPRVIRKIAEGGSFNDLDAAVMALDAVDLYFRDSGLWPGNIYLAGVEALWLALDLMGDAPLFRGPEKSLTGGPAWVVSRSPGRARPASRRPPTMAPAVTYLSSRTGIQLTVRDGPLKWLTGRSDTPIDKRAVNRPD